MRKLLAATYKEFLLLTRDWGGLAVLFLMPLLLVIVITTVQDSTFKTLQDQKTRLLIVDRDQGAVAEEVLENIENSNLFTTDAATDEAEAANLVQKGRYQLAIVIPEGLSRDLNQKIEQNVQGILEKFGVEEEPLSMERKPLEPKEIKLYFDPATQQAFKRSVRDQIDKMVAKIESQAVYRAFQEELTDDRSEEIFDTESFITFTEIIPGGDQRHLIPNSTQHNIPAWTLFAIFFIILPLSINMVHEKNQGTFVRLRTQPVPYAVVLAGKAIVFMVVALLQFGLMLLVGVYLFPMMGLPRLEMAGQAPLLFLVAFFAALAAIGLGLLVGTLARTQEQSAPFSATFVVILAAIGGVWVPVFAMPPFMQLLAGISPMNWGLNAFYDVFLRQVGFAEIIFEITLLFLFFLVTAAIAILYHERKSTV